MATIKETTQKLGICIGCGICAAVCPEDSISMYWGKRKKWVPKIDEAKCTDCGLCYKKCPNTPQRISEYATDAAKAGERFGLPETAQYFIAYDLNPENRIRSASGGALTAILMYLLESGEIDGVIASVPVPAPIGEPHYKLRIMQSIEELDGARSSHYHPLSYDKVLRELVGSSGRYALLGVPCAIRGIKRLPTKVQSKIFYTFCLVCGVNVTGQFIDCLANQEGILDGETFIANIRDKIGGIHDASNYNNYFKLQDREIRRNRFQTAFTDMWRNYFFAQECCLYCPDFYGADADLSVKDAWGRLSSDPLGISLLTVRNPELVDTLKEMAKGKKIFLESCDADEIFQSQIETPIFKHIKVRDRLVWKSGIRQELIRSRYPLGTSRRWWKMNSLKYWEFRINMSLANFFFTNWGRVPVKMIISINRIVIYSVQFVMGILLKFTKISRLFPKPIKAIIKILIRSPLVLIRFLRGWPVKKDPNLKTSDLQESSFKAWGYYSKKWTGKPRILMAAGHGYGNVGDEAQCGAAINRWHRVYPECKITLFSPNPGYTEALHNEQCEWAPRVAWFRSNTIGPYDGNSRRFIRYYKWLKFRLVLSAHMVRRGIPLLFCNPREARILQVLQNHDLLHISGGGFLTGKTRSRLWENSLLMRMCQILDVPYILTGHNIGVFQNTADREIAYSGLKKAKYIGLRDGGISEIELAEIGIKGDHVQSTCDDALLCPRLESDLVKKYLENAGANPDKPWAAVNFHHWGQKEEDKPNIEKRFGEICDYLIEKHGLQVILIAMTPTDVEPEENILRSMKNKAVLAPYNPDYNVVRGIIADSEICFTMKHHPIVFAQGEGIPVVCVALDDYYYHKNKGALENTGHADYMLSQKEFYSVKSMEIIDSALNNKEKIANEMLCWVNQMKEIELDVYRNAFKMSN